MAEPRSSEIAELRSQVHALSERSRKNAANQSKRLAVIEVVLVFLIVYFAWDYNSRLRPFKTAGAIYSGRTDIQEEIVNEGVKFEKAITAQLAATTNENTLLRHELYRLHKGSDAFRTKLRTITKERNEEITSLQQNITVLRHQIDRLKWTLTRELKVVKHQFEHKHDDEAAFTSRIAVLRQEVVDLLRDKQSKLASKLESTLIKQEISHLEKSEAALKEEIKFLKNKPARNCSLQDFTELSHLLQQESIRLKDNEQVRILEKEFEKMRQQLKQTQDEAARAGAALRQEITDLLRDKQSKTAFQLESTLVKQQMDRLKQNEEVLKQEIKLFRNECASNHSQQEVTQPSQRQIENEQILKREFEILKQQLKQKQDEASTAAAALRQELLNLLRDKQSKTAFQLESTLVKQQMDRLKQNEETLKQEIEFLKRRPSSLRNCSLQEVKDLMEQEFDQFKESKQVLERDYEKMKQQLKQNQDEAARTAATLRQELVDLLRDKQSKTAFQLESTLMKQEMDRLKQNEEGLKKEIDKMQANGTLKTETMQLSQKLDTLIEKHMNTTIVINEHEVQLTQLAKEQESARGSFLQDITQPRERDEQIRTVRMELDQLKQNELVFQRNIEIMKQKYESEVMSRALEMEQLRYETQDLRREVKKSLLNLSNVCSQISYSTTEECKTDLSTEILWGLAAIAALAIIFFSLYHQNYQSKIDANSQRIDQLTRKQDTDQRNIDAQKRKLDAERQRMDRLTEQQEADREQLVQEIDAQRIRMGLIRQKVYQFIEEHLVQNIDALRLRQERVQTVLAEQRLPALLPFQITMPNFLKHKSAGDIWYSKPFYTDPRGYKMCLAVYADGAHVAEGKHVSIFIYLMRGEFDDEHMWPFRGKITIYLLNQFEAREHREITFTSEGNGNRVTERERASTGIGEECVVFYRDLSYVYDTHTQYLKYDSLRFRVANVEIKEDTVPVIPIDIIMTDFEGRKKDSEQWFSEPFYTNPGGYKMCLRVDPNGSDEATGTHVSVYVTLMQGEHDDHLKWPFRGDITIRLLNQEKDEKTIPFDDRAGDDVAGRVIERQGRARKGWGAHKFIAHTELSANSSEHVKNNCLGFQVLKVVVKSR